MSCHSSGGRNQLFDAVSRMELTVRRRKDFLLIDPNIFPRKLFSVRSFHRPAGLLGENYIPEWGRGGRSGRLSRAAFAAVSMFNYFLSWKQAGRIDDSFSATGVDAINVWHLFSLSFLLAMCAEVSVCLRSLLFTFQGPISLILASISYSFLRFL